MEGGLVYLKTTGYGLYMSHLIDNHVYYRIHQAGILCPEPIILRSHVLVMGFIGTDSW